MNFNDTMTNMKALEEKIRCMTESLKQGLTEAVSKQRLEGAEPLKTASGLYAASIRLSAIKRTPSLNLSAEYYLPQSQVNAVQHKLASCKTATQICKAVKDMLDEKRVCMGSHKAGEVSNNYTYLNEATLKILRDSELGKYVMDDSTTEPEKKAYRNGQFEIGNVPDAFLF